MADNQIERILPLLNLPAHQVLPKSMEIERMMRLKVPNGTLKKGEVCRPIIAIDLACRLLQVSILKETLISQAAVPKKLYQDSYNSCKRLLHLTFPTNLTIDSLSMKYGNERISKFAKSLLFTYLQAIGNLNSPPLELLRAVAFFVTAKHHQINLKLTKFLDDNDLSAVDFEPLVKDFEARMKEHSVHFHHEDESEESEPAISVQPLQERILEGNSWKSFPSSLPEPPSSPSTVSSLTTTSADYLLPQPTNKYKSNNSKRVAADSILGHGSGQGRRQSQSGGGPERGGDGIRVEEMDELRKKKRQFTEEVFQMWYAEVKEQVSLSANATQTASISGNSLQK